MTSARSDYFCFKFVTVTNGACDFLTIFYCICFFNCQIYVGAAVKALSDEQGSPECAAYHLCHADEVVSSLEGGLF